MSEARINDTTIYEGLYPSVFKKVDTTDIQINPFQANKTFTVLSGSATSSVLPLQAVYIDTNYLPALGSNLIYNDAANIDGSLQSVTYFSINHLFYKNKNQPYNNFGQTDLNFIKKHLYETASVFSFPQNKVGEGIKPGSFTLNVADTASFTSDEYGNINDTTFDTGSIISDVQWYEGFNEYFDTSRIDYESNNVTYVDGVNASNGDQLPIGLSANFTGSSYIKSALPGAYNRDENYAISFYVSGANASTSNQLIITKASSSRSPQYPFRVELSGSNQIVFSVAGTNEYSMQVTSSIVADQWRHVVCEKSGSTLNMYVDGTIHASQSNPGLLTADCSPVSASDARIDNSDDLYIGGFGSSSLNLSGKLDEIRIYNKSLTSTEVGYLADRTEGGTFIQTGVVGNVFEKQGIAVVSTTDYRYHGITDFAYTASYKSTVTIHELGVTTRIDQGDFNMSTNVSLTKDDNETYRCFVASSSFAPYITTIGLYDDAGRMLAIGKLAQPIRKRNDVDINFLVKIDLDKKLIK
jgi:hypothetical protein